jgi:hypothetical protein
VFADDQEIVDAVYEALAMFGEDSEEGDNGNEDDDGRY